MTKDSVANAQIDFGANLLKEINSENPQKSVVVSPISVAVALACVHAGAKEDTLEELSALLDGRNYQQEKINDYFHNLNKTLSVNHQNYTLDSVNRIYLHKGFSINQTYQQTLQTQYGGQIEVVDFLNKQETPQEINAFVKKHTHGKITELVTSDSFDKTTRFAKH